MNETKETNQDLLKMNKDFVPESHIEIVEEKKEEKPKRKKKKKAE